MVEGRGSEVVILGILMVLLQYEVAHAANTVVGDTKGWVKGVAGWEKGKRFFIGEGLEFNYPKGAHNVVAVNKAGYDACKASPKDKVYSSGHDIVPLVKGDNYFICTFPGHCASMKIKITLLEVVK